MKGKTNPAALGVKALELQALEIRLKLLAGQLEQHNYDAAAVFGVIAGGLAKLGPAPSEADYVILLSRALMAGRETKQRAKQYEVVIPGLWAEAKRLQRK